MKTSEILQKTIDLFGIFRHCQGYYAYDDCGRTVRTSDPAATGFCIVGALSRASALGELSKPISTVKDVIRKVDPEIDELGGVVPWNDTPGRTKAEVIEVLTKAKALALAENECLGN